MKRAKRIAALAVAFCLLLSMMPVSIIAEGQAVYGVTTTIGDCQFTAGKATEFTATTHVSEGAEQKTVVGAFELYDSEGNKVEDAEQIRNIVKLEYQEYPSGVWYEFYGEFGPSAGFPMMDGVTSTFKATFKTEGNYQVKVLMKDVNDEKNPLCETGLIALNVAPFVNGTVQTTLPTKLHQGKDVYFTCTTTGNSHAGETVRGAFAIEGVENVSEVATLKYKDSASGEWYEFYGDFGPAAGFSLTDATSSFCVNFKETGTYNIKIYMKKLDGTELCAVEKTVNVVVPSALATSISETEFVTGQPTEFTVTSTANGDGDEWVYGKFVFNGNNWDAVEKLEYLEGTEWLTLPKDAFFGPAETGFPMSNATSYFRVTFKQPGTFNCQVALVDATNTDIVLCSVEENIIVIDNAAPEITDVTVDNENYAQSKTVTVKAEDKGGSTVTKVVYGTEKTYTDELPAVTANEDGSFSFQVNANGTYYIWAVDGYNNHSENAKKVTVENVDTTAPEFTVEASPDTWTNGEVVVTGTANDDASGVAKVVYNTTGNYADEKSEANLNEDGTYSFTVSHEGYFNGSYYVWVEDAVGNLSESKSVTIRIETISPVFKLFIATPNTWTNGNVQVTGAVLEQSAGESGVAKVVYSTNNTYAEDLPTATLNEDGTYSFTIESEDAEGNKYEYNGNYYLWVVDNAGNVSESVEVKIQMESTIPEVNTIVADPNTWTNGDVTVSGTVSDIASKIGNSGVVKVVYSTDNTYTTKLPEALLDKENGTYSFTVESNIEDEKKDNYEYNKNYYVWAIDEAGNVSEVAEVLVRIDTTAPVVESATAPSWTKEGITVNGTVSDIASQTANSGVAKVVYSTDDTYAEDLPVATLNEDGKYTFTVSNANEYNGNYYVWAIDAAGNVSEVAEVLVQIDTTIPVVDSIKADPDAWTNTQVKVTGTVSDIASQTANSGVMKVVYNTTGNYADEKAEAILNKEEGTYTFTVPNTEEYNGNYYVWAIDAAGNVSEVAEVLVQIDTTIPVVDSIKAEPVVAEGEEKPTNWTNTPVKVSGTVSDLNSEIGNSGAAKVVYGTSLLESLKDIKDVEKAIEDKTLFVATLNEKEGKYYFIVENNEEYNGDYYVWAVDNAGNVSEVAKVLVQIDTTNPTGSVTANFNFANGENGADYDLKTPWTSVQKNLTYTLWANKSIQVVVVGTNDVSAENNAEDASGDVKVEYYIDFFAGDELAFKTESELDAVTTWEDVKEKPIPAIDSDNRFIVYVKLTDAAGNYSYISTNGLIVDTHKPTGDRLDEKIDIEVNHAKEAAVELLENEKDTKDPAKITAALYGPNDKVEINIAVYEPNYLGEDKEGDVVYSGLNTITYQFFVGGKAQPVVTLFDVEENVNEGGKTDGDLGLITEWIGTITFEKEELIDLNSNDVLLVVTAIDNANNIAEGSTRLMIDITAPEITVEYDNNQFDSVKYFQTKRVATIVVTERNFNAGAFSFAFKKTGNDGKGGLIVVEGDELIWTHGYQLGGNGDKNTHTATFVFEDDADYVLSDMPRPKTESNEIYTEPYFQYSDLANNSFAQVNFVGEAAMDFTVDKLNPQVTVTYDNNNAQNDKYFDATRTATVIITEHNFPRTADGGVDYERIVFTMNGARGAQVPEANWYHEGDKHIATFYYVADGDYSFKVQVTDLAGRVCENSSVDYKDSVEPMFFVIDTDAEMISQEGVENGVAYGYDATVIPNIRIEDINLQEYTVTLVGVQKDKTIDLTEEVDKLLEKDTELVTGILDIFETKQDLDGIYTLTLTSKDMAGNEDSLEIVFTVNRYGSVYVYEQYLLDLIANGGSYVYSVNEDLIITEYNADKLVPDSLKIEITVDGRPLENVQFTVTPEINNEVSTGSSGWYQYKYTISKDNFATDGVYKISVSSKDATGNTPQNTNYEDMGMLFRVDSTKAEITSVVGLEKAIINAQELTVKYTAFDTIGIKSIVVYVDGVVVDEITDFAEDFNNYSGSFTLTESTSTQVVRIVVEDMAGNITDTNAEDFAPAYDFHKAVTVSTNFFVRWYANKPLFWGSIGGVVVVAGALWFFLAGKKKKEE